MRDLATPPRTPYVVGLTGGIGSGKSSAAQHFVAHGVPLIDTDLIARQLTAPAGAALPALRAGFGDQLFLTDGSINRQAMRELVFSQATQRRRLEGILHPMIEQEVRAQQTHIAEQGAPYLILDVPLLYETPALQAYCHRILLIDCHQDTQLSRVMARNRLPEEQVRAIIAAQSTRQQRQHLAHDIVVNEGSLDALHAQLHRLHQRYLQLAVAENNADASSKA